MFIDIKNRANDPEIIKLLAACIFENCEKRAAKDADEYKQRSKWKLFGWSENKKILAVCGCEVRPDKAIIRHIATGESTRGQGIGRKMIAALRQRYNLPIEAETDDDAVDFYRKCGFEAALVPKQKYSIRRWTCVLPV